MQQDDVAVPPLLFDALKNNVGARPGPILRINILQHHEVIQVLGDLQRSQFAQLRRARIRGVRRPEQGGRTPRDRFQQQLSRVQLQPDMFRPANRQVRMVVSVIPDFVPLIHDSPDQRRIILRILAHHKKGSLHVRRFQDIENFWSPCRIGTVIEGQHHLMLSALALMIQRGKLREFHIPSDQIPLTVDREFAHSVGTRLIHCDNFAIAQVRDRVGALQNLQRRARGRLDLEITGHAQRIPDGRILRA